jgi:callose synthase
VATTIQGGAVVGCLVLKPMMPYLMDVTRGYPYYPREDDNFSLSMRREVMYAVIWLVSTVLVMAAAIYRDGSMHSFSPLSLWRSGYSRIPTNEPSGPSSTRNKKLPSHRDPPVNVDAYNMFDSADLPPRLTEYANMVYTACEDLGNFFGFQDSSVRNQAEHLLILLSNNRRYMSSHILPPSVQPPSPIHALHAKVFSNYVKWCRAMGVPPHFSKMNSSMNAPPAVASRVVDLVLWFCIWGEGSNLRHMSECLWFLYHKMMEEYIRSEGYTQTRSLYAGHYLDHVVFPIYEIVANVRWNGVLC